MGEIYVRIEPYVKNELEGFELDMIFSYVQDLSKFRRRGQHVLELSPNRQAVLKITHYKKSAILTFSLQKLTILTSLRKNKIMISIH